MNKLSLRQQRILKIVLFRDKIQSSEVLAEMKKNGESISLVTVKRNLSLMAKLGILSVSGSGRSTNYTVSTIGRIFANIIASEYCTIEPDSRHGLKHYNFDLFSNFPSDIFDEQEKNTLSLATKSYLKRTNRLTPSIIKKEMERLIIELSWKSSKIEGNTYTLLDTENLIKNNIKATGKSREETQMILNHREAFEYIYSHQSNFKTITKNNLERLHSILVKDLGVDIGLRKKPVGITASIYQPLDNAYQISEAVILLSKTIKHTTDPFAKALLALAGISYIQPFADGNKRTARLMTNAVLLAYNLAPLSYRSVDENSYREAMLVFYELNSIIPIKEIFITQYSFAATNYLVR